MYKFFVLKENSVISLKQTQESGIHSMDIYCVSDIGKEWHCHPRTWQIAIKFS